MKYFIVGFKGCGKSTMGRLLAEAWNMEFLDLDAHIEERENCTVPELYTQLGDEGFRQKEREALLDVLDRDNIVIALGGGAPCYFNNMDLMLENGGVIYIELDNETLVSRLKEATKDRPIVLNKTEEELRKYVEDIRKNRESYYQRANYHINGRGLTLEKMITSLQTQQKA